MEQELLDYWIKKWASMSPNDNHAYEPMMDFIDEHAPLVREHFVDNFWGADHAYNDSLWQTFAECMALDEECEDDFNHYEGHADAAHKLLDIMAQNYNETESTTLPEATTRFGASLGRRSSFPPALDRNEPITVYRISFVDGDYDRYGAYWGSGDGQQHVRMIRAYDLEGNRHDAFIRSKTNMEAMEKWMARTKFNDVSFKVDYIF